MVPVGTITTIITGVITITNAAITIGGTGEETVTADHAVQDLLEEMPLLQWVL